MPIDQKLDMAIKYGSHRASQLESVIRNLIKALGLWKTVADLICEREEKLAEIEIFETKASDPM